MGIQGALKQRPQGAWEGMSVAMARRREPCLWLVVLLLFLAIGCHSRSVGITSGERAVKRRITQEMESEEVEMVFDSGADAEEEMVSAFVLDASGKISFGQPRPNATAMRMEGGETERGKMKGLEARPAFHERFIANAFYLGSPLLVLALLRSLANSSETGEEKSEVLAEPEAKIETRHGLVKNPAKSTKKLLLLKEEDQSPKTTKTKTR